MKSGSRQVTHRNHYVPRFYLKLWSTNGHSVQVYDTVVSRERVRPWATGAICRTACWDDFYTNKRDGVDDDVFERIMESHFETPAKPVFDKAIKGNRLSDGEMAIMVNFLVAQLVRTPAWFLNVQRIHGQVLEPVTRDVIEGVFRDYENGTLNREEAARQPYPSEPFGSTLKTTIDAVDKGAKVTVETYFGRKPFLNNALRCITGRVGDHLRSQNWRIMDVPERYPLFASDNPVSLIGIYGNKMRVGADLGIGAANLVIMMPICERRMIITQVGASRDAMERMVLTDEAYEQLQHATILNATRYIYAPKPSPVVAMVRPRIVDAEYYEFMKNAREKWAKEQEAAENYFKPDDNGR